MSEPTILPSPEAPPSARRTLRPLFKAGLAGAAVLASSRLMGCIFSLRGAPQLVSDAGPGDARLTDAAVEVVQQGPARADGGGPADAESADATANIE